MADLLAFPDDEAKAVRRYVAQVRHWIERIDGLTLLARAVSVSREAWIAEARKVIEDISHLPAPIRSECNLLPRLIILKGLVDEAELESFSAIDAKVRDYEALAAQLFTPRDTDARRAPASLTSELVSDNLRLPGASRDAGSAAGPVFPPRKGRTGSAVAGVARFAVALFHAAKMWLLPHGVTEKRNDGFSHRGGPVRWGGRGGRS